MKFECNQCGECCRKFGVRGFLPLWEWEIEKLKKTAEEKGISLNIQPGEMLFDKKSGLAFFGNYILLQEPCPFLMINKCSIYENRPLICRIFPLYETPLLKKDTFDLSSFLECPNFDARKFMIELGGLEDGSVTKLNKAVVIKKYKEVFGDIFIYAFQEDIIRRFIDDTIKKLLEDKKIKLRKVNKLDYPKYHSYPFFEFLVKIRVISESRKEEMINLFKDKKYAANIIDDVEKNL